MRQYQPKTNKVFVRKSFEAQLYKWSPLPTDLTKKTRDQVKGGKLYFCTATAGSQGQDWTTSYVYNLVVVNSQQEHLAYVECDYVQ